MTATILHGDSRELLASLESDSIDSLVTDPPAGISFMGKRWDTPGASFVERKANRATTFDHVAGNHNAESNADKVRDLRGRGRRFREEMTPIFELALRAMKPGAHGLVWALPRTSHWTATALEDAGFEIRDVGVHLFGQGFPKSHNVERACDDACFNPEETRAVHPWNGWGTALKPASEHWILVRKPLDGTVAANVLEHGTGALNIDGCRLAYQGDADRSSATPHGRATSKVRAIGAEPDAGREEDRVEFARAEQRGRWPANVTLEHGPGCREVGTRRVRRDLREAPGAIENDGIFGMGSGTKLGTVEEDLAVWECEPGCPVAELNAQSGRLVSRPMPAGTRRKASKGEGGYGGGFPDVATTRGYAGDAGGASRFFYVAKAPKSDKGKDNTHPTVKNTALMRWLIRLVTPPGGTVLDPFAGSGSTGVAAVAEGMHFIGMEREEEYVSIARRRIERAVPPSASLPLLR